MESDGTFDLLPKKEVIKIKKEYEKLNKVLCGIRTMEKLPDAMIVVDPKKELNAIKEARKLNIPVFGLVDTNCDPDDVDYVIPGNDDAVRSVQVILGVLNNAICEGKKLPLVDYITEEHREDANENKVTAENANETAEIKETSAPVKDEEKDLSALTVVELRAMAKESGITGTSTMKKDELIKALQK